VKAFSFALERVLDWRRVEALLEENKLEQIWARVRSLAGQDAELERGLAVAEDELSARARTPGESLSAAELWALTAFRRHIANQRVRLAAERAGFDRQMEAQTAALARKRREVKLIENLRERKRAAWTAELDREIAQQAEESHRAKWSSKPLGSGSRPSGVR